MAKKKLAAVVKIQIPAGGATPAPPVGTAFGPHGINIMDFCKAYNAATENQRGTDHPGRDLDLRGPVVHVRHQDAADAVPAPAGRRDREGLVADAAGEGGQGHQARSRQIAETEDARPERDRPRRRHGPGRGHRALDGPRRRLSSATRHDRRRRRTSPTGRPGTTPREPPTKEREHDQARQEVHATRQARSTGSSSTTRPRRSTS